MVTAPPATSPDQVIQWNRILLGILRTPGAQPATVHPTRSMAILHAAVYDAVNAIARQTPPTSSTSRRRGTRRAPPRRPRRHTACSFGSSRPSRPVSTQTSRTPFRRFPTGAAEGSGYQGRAGSRCRDRHAANNDGSAATPIPFVPGTNPGDYQPTPPAFVQPFFTHWRFVQPFALRTADQSRPGPPPAATSATYTASFDEVKVWARRQHQLAPRTDQIGRFWKAPIQNYWNEIAQTIAVGPDDAARTRGFRAPRPDGRGLGDRVLRRQVHPPLLAADHRGPRRGQPGNPEPPAIRLDAARDDGARSVLSGGTRRRQLPPVPTCSAPFSAATATTSRQLRGCCRSCNARSRASRGSGGSQSQPDLRRPALPLRPRRGSELGRSEIAGYVLRNFLLPHGRDDR